MAACRYGNSLLTCIQLDEHAAPLMRNQVTHPKRNSISYPLYIIIIYLILFYC